MAITPDLHPTDEYPDPNDTLWVYGRGLMDPDPVTSRSCIFEGAIKRGLLTIERVLLSPETHPIADGTGQLKGYEDQTLAWGAVNFRSPGSDGLYCTQAIRDSSDTWVTNIFHLNLESEEGEVAFTREEAVAAWQGGAMQNPRGIKELEFWQKPDGRLQVLMEIYTYGHSFIGIGDVLDGKIVNLRPFPFTGTRTWYSQHTSPAAPPISLGDGTSLLIFNGRSAAPFRGPKATQWAHGAARIEDATGKALWTSRVPWVYANTDEPPGPNNKYIAFASNYHLAERNGKELRLVGFHHPQDRYIERVTLEVRLLG